MYHKAGHGKSLRGGTVGAVVDCYFGQVAVLR